MTTKQDIDNQPLHYKYTECQEYTNKDHVVSLDFGSTCSAFSFACVDSGIDIKNHSDIICSVKKWPRKHNTTSSKIPSAVYLNYKKEPTKKIGMEALIISNKRNADGILLRNFKPLLGRSYDPELDEGEMKIMTRCDIYNATTMFFQVFYKMGLSEMNRFTGRLFRRSAITSRVVSVPSTWSRKKRDALKEAIMEAKIVPKESFDRDFMFISDAAAAVLHCETHFNSFQMNIGRSFIVLDAGGSTTKISVFTIVESGDPESQPIMTELIPSSQVCHGGAHLDDAFKRLVLEKIGNCQIDYKMKHIKYFVKYFVENIKNDFTFQEKEEEEDEVEIPVPASMGLSDNFFDNTGLIKDGCLVLTKEEIVNRVFSPKVDPILDYLEKTLSELPENRRNLDDLLLVGGLGESAYLYKKVEQKLESIDFSIGLIRQPPDGRFAVSKGSISYVLRPRYIPTEFVRYVFELQISNAPVIGVCHQKEEVTSCCNRTTEIDTLYCNIKTEKLQLEKYDTYYSSVVVQHPGILKFELYPIGREPNSSIYSDSEFKCEAIVDTSITKVKEGTDVEFQIRVETRATHIEFSVIYKNDVISKNKIRCEQATLPKYTPDEKKSVKRKRSLMELLKRAHR